MTTKWRTRVDTPLARCLGVVAHMVVFRHRDDPGGSGCAVALMVPERTEQQIREGLEVARLRRARILVLGDTARQVEAMATRIALCCAQHQRVSYERARSGQFGPLS